MKLPWIQPMLRGCGAKKVGSSARRSGCEEFDMLSRRRCTLRARPPSPRTRRNHEAIATQKGPRNARCLTHILNMCHRGERELHCAPFDRVSDTETTRVMMCQFRRWRAFHAE